MTLEPLNRHEVARHLEACKADTLQEWEGLARSRIAAAQAQNRLALRDSLPQFLDRLVATLICNDPKAELEKNAQVAAEHGEDRAKQPEYSLADIIFEYHILRALIVKKIEACGAPDSESRIFIHDYFDRGISNAAVRYHEIESYRAEIQKAELEATRIEAERASQAKTIFLANMSHEMRTPLGAIMGFIDLLKDEITPEERDEYIAVIDRNAHHLLRVIDDILDLTKVEAGKMIIEKIEFSLLEFLADFSSLAAIKARDNGIFFEFKAETALPEFVISDPTRLKQILMNVVGNAIKFTEKGLVELIASYNDHHLEFRVRDTGRGISSEQRVNLFQAFTQADASTTRKFGGTGLGLVITKKLSQALGGDFDLIESELGKGSTFDVTFPVSIPATAKLVPVRELRVDSTTEANGTYPVDLKGFEILLVEDSIDNQFLMKRMLAKSGAVITVASDGSQGLAYASARSYDVILMDIQMPIMDGHEAVLKLRAKGYKGPVVALTAHAMKEERERAVQSGFSHFLTKPIHRKSLIDLLLILHSPLTLRL